MRKEDLAEVSRIDREAFPGQWPQPNYGSELRNKLARYIVICEETVPGNQPPVLYPGGKGLLYRLRRVLGLSGKEPPDSDRVIGFCGVWVIMDEAHITNIAVAQSHRRQGLGELMLLHIIDIAAQMKADMLTLEVRASNKTAQQLYAKYGFAEVGLRRGYYSDNHEDALLMTTESIGSGSFKELLSRLKAEHKKRWTV